MKKGINKNSFIIGAFQCFLGLYDIMISPMVLLIFFVVLFRDIFSLLAKRPIMFVHCAKFVFISALNQTFVFSTLQNVAGCQHGRDFIDEVDKKFAIKI